MSDHARPSATARQDLHADRADALFREAIAALEGRVKPALVESLHASLECGGSRA